MSADWFYIGRGGWFKRRKTIGPISETELLARIKDGEITPETPLRSVQKTRDRWMPMEEIPPAYDHYKKLNSAGD